jgi:hypothetical protein
MYRGSLVACVKLVSNEDIAAALLSPQRELADESRHHEQPMKPIKPQVCGRADVRGWVGPGRLDAVDEWKGVLAPGQLREDGQLPGLRVRVAC